MKHLTEEALDLGDKKIIDRDAPGEPFYQALEKVLSSEDDSDVDSVEEGLENLLKVYPDEPFWSGWPAVEAKANCNKEERAALYMLISQFIRRGLAPIDADKCESSVRSGLFRLVAAGAAVIVPGKQGELIEESQSMVLLSPWACRTLFRQSSPVDCLGFMGQECDVLSADAIPARELFFDRRQEEQFKEMVRIADEGVFGQIAERCVAKGFPAGVACLLYGPPGTGKTEAVRQVARASGSPLYAMIMELVFKAMEQKLWDLILSRTIATQKYADRNNREHIQICEAILAGRADEAHEIMTEHMNQLFERFWSEEV